MRGMAGSSMGDPPCGEPAWSVAFGDKRFKLALGGRFLRQIVRELDLDVVLSLGRRRQTDANRDACQPISYFVQDGLTRLVRRSLPTFPIRGSLLRTVPPAYGYAGQ